MARSVEGLPLPPPRRAERADVPAIAALVGECFPDNPKADPTVLAWQQWDNPFGASSSWVVDHPKEPGLVAHFTAFPMPVAHGDERTTVLKSADAATVEWARGRRVFPSLLQAVKADQRDRGLPLGLYSPSNPASRAALDREGFRALGAARTALLPLDGRLAAVLGNRVGGGAARVAGHLGGGVARLATRRLPKPDGTPVVGVPDGLDDLWQATRAESHASVVHDERWVRWRYLSHPHLPYTLWANGGQRLDAFAASVEHTVLDTPVTAVLDLRARSCDAAAALVSAIAERSRAAALAGLGLAGTPSVSTLREAGLYLVPQRAVPRSATLGLVTAAPSPLAAASWNVTWGDLDHV